MVKRGAGAVEEEDEERWISRMRMIIREENKIIDDAFEKRCSATETQQDQLDPVN